VPISEDKVEKVIKYLKGKLSAGIDEVTDLIAEECTKFMKNPLLTYVMLQWNQVFFLID